MKKLTDVVYTTDSGTQLIRKSGDEYSLLVRVLKTVTELEDMGKACLEAAKDKAAEKAK